MKIVYKVLIILGVYIGSLIFFAQGMSERFFNDDLQLTEMADATLPIVTIEVDGCELNTLHGYASDLDEMIMRESIVPLGIDRTFTVLIDEYGSDVKKLRYDILDENGNEVESDSMIVLDTGGQRKSVTIRTQENLKSASEYVAKITLITNQSKRIFYYTRLKLYENGHLHEKLDFVDELHNALFDVVKASDYSKYFESSKKSDNSTFASVNINSSFEMLTYGELDPVVVFEAVPTVTEFYENMASIALDYVISVETEYGTELYEARECYRMNYTPSRIYLYNYERTMNAIYDPEHISISQDEFKIGITTDVDIQTVSNGGNTHFAFVYRGELMVYSSDSNELIRVFSFRQNNGDYLRDLYNQHDVKVLNVSEEGDVDFYVYGYMNRGEYEGRVGILLYRFYRNDLRIEEQAYLPINSSYQLLRYDMGDFLYRNDFDLFYFTMYNSIFAYNITTRELQTIASDVPPESFVYCPEEKYIAWQNTGDSGKADGIVIMNLIDGSRIVVSAPIGNTVRLYGRINNNLVYGFVNPADAYTYADGSVMLPAWKLRICDSSGVVLKDYDKEGFYIDRVEIGTSELRLVRVSRGSNGKYVPQSDDFVQNRKVEENKPFSESKRVTDRLLTECYISLPKSIDIVYQPLFKTTQNTVIEEDATVRVTTPDSVDNVFYAYSFGRIVFSSKKAGETILLADSKVGTVIDKSGKIAWERGVKATRREITSILPSFDKNLNAMQNCMKLMLSYKNVDADTSSYDAYSSEVCEWLRTCMKSTPVDLTGCTLDEVLYYVHKQRPVIALRPDGSTCLITAYDQSGITVLNPQTGGSTRYQTGDAETLFAEAGNKFISYIE